MNSDLLLIIIEIFILEREYSSDITASKRCFCNQFEKLASEFGKLLKESNDAND